ncbi:unnamed protein product [Caenorhabditis brenneri]
MGGCPGADMSQKVMCCAGKMQAIVLGGLFMFFSFVVGGLMAWQIEDMKTKIEEIEKSLPPSNIPTSTPPPSVNNFYYLMALPGSMFLSAICLFIMLAFNPKLMLIICIIWPVLSLGLSGGLGWLVYEFYEESRKHTGGGVSEFVDKFNKESFYIIYVVPGGAVINALCAIYCIVLLICLGCCQRAGAGKEVDLYSLESENRDDSESSTTKSHISIE